MTTYVDILSGVNAYRPVKMTNAEAAELLTTLRHTVEIGDKMAEAIDLAVKALVPEVSPNIDSIIKAVAHATGVSEDIMLSRERHSEYSNARYMVYWLAYRYTSHTLTEIGRRFNRSHAMVIYGLRKGDDYFDRPLLNPTWVKQAKSIVEQLEINRHG